MIRDRVFQRKERILEKLTKSSGAGIAVEVESPATLANANSVDVDENGIDAEMEEEEHGSLNVVGGVPTNPNLEPRHALAAKRNKPNPPRGKDKQKRRKRTCKNCQGTDCPGRGGDQYCTKRN